jgi:hypothetical protein
MADTNGQTEENHESSTQRFKSIRRSSFADSYYDIKEEVSDEGSDVSSLGASKQPIEQEDDLLTSDPNTIEKSNRSFAPFDDVDLSGSRPVLDAQRSESSFDIDTSVLAELEASSRRTTLKRSNISGAQEDDPKVDNDDEQDSQNKASPEFPTRRKGSMERRMLLKAGLGMRAANERIARHTTVERRKSPMSDEDDFSNSFAASTRRNSTGSTVRGKRMSMESLASFSSAASATSGEGVEVGNLTFVTEMATTIQTAVVQRRTIHCPRLPFLEREQHPWCVWLGENRTILRTIADHPWKRLRVHQAWRKQKQRRLIQTRLGTCISPRGRRSHVAV